MLLRRMFARKWLLATLLVLAGTAVCIRLGIWQLDRLAERRQFNAQVQDMRSQPPLQLDASSAQQLDHMEWRAVHVQGSYDFEHQVAIRNQYNGSQYGYHLLTPLRFGEEAILVDRGWIPANGNATPTAWYQYDEAGQVDLTGQIRLGHPKPALGGIADEIPTDGSSLSIWNNADLAQIAAQIPYPILPVYIQQAPIEGDEMPPIPFQPELDLSEGPHMGYAVQWFTFATILFVGYPFFLKKQEQRSL